MRSITPEVLVAIAAVFAAYSGPREATPGYAGGGGAVGGDDSGSGASHSRDFGDPTARTLDGGGFIQCLAFDGRLESRLLEEKLLQAMYEATSHAQLLTVAIGALLGLWYVLRLPRVRPDVSQGAVAYVEGPVRLLVLTSSPSFYHAVLVQGRRFGLPRSLPKLAHALQEGMPCRLYHVPATNRFVAIEPLV
jgi:hypothetical protein